jgi:hypothetical protein
VATCFHFYCTHHKSVLMLTQKPWSLRHEMLISSGKFHPKRNSFWKCLPRLFSGHLSPYRPPLRLRTRVYIKSYTLLRILVCTYQRQYSLSLFFLSLRRMQKIRPIILGSPVDRWIYPLPYPGACDAKKNCRTYKLHGAFIWLQPKHLSFYLTEKTKGTVYIPPVLTAGGALSGWISGLRWAKFTTIIYFIINRFKIEMHFLTYNFRHQTNSNKITVFWDEHRADRYRRFGEKSTAYTFLPPTSSTLKMDAVRSSEMSISIYQTSWRHIPDYSNLHSLSRVNVKPRTFQQ